MIPRLRAGHRWISARGRSSASNGQRHPGSPGPGGLTLNLITTGSLCKRKSSDLSMLQRIELCFNHRRFVRKVKAVEFSTGINLIVGPNGSGKSSVLKAVYSCRQCRKTED